MTASPVVVMCLKGVEAVRVFREMTGVTNGRNAAPEDSQGRFLYERPGQYRSRERFGRKRGDRGGAFLQAGGNL